MPHIVSYFSREKIGRFWNPQGLLPGSRLLHIFIACYVVGTPSGPKPPRLNRHMGVGVLVCWCGCRFFVSSFHGVVTTSVPPAFVVLFLPSSSIPSPVQSSPAQNYATLFCALLFYFFQSRRKKIQVFVLAGLCLVCACIKLNFIALARTANRGVGSQSHIWLRI